MNDNVGLPRECLTSDLSNMSASSLNTALKYFIFEAAKKDGSEYPSSTLYSLYGSFQSYLRFKHSRINIFEDTVCEEAKAALDAAMKEKAAAGLGVASRTHSEEAMLWGKDVLGDNTPQKLVDTILYLTGLHFSLRGGNEHRQFRLFQQTQITGPYKDDSGRSYLQYKEDTSKTNVGGLRQRKVVPKQVRAYDNPSCPERCYIRRFQKYKQLW